MRSGAAPSPRHRPSPRSPEPRSRYGGSTPFRSSRDRSTLPPKRTAITFQLHDLKLLTDAVSTTLYALSDTPDPAIISFEWDAIDDAGTIYRQLPDRRVAGTLPGFSRAFAPAPPPAARRIAFAIRRIHLSSLDAFATDLELR